MSENVKNVFLNEILKAVIFYLIISVFIMFIFALILQTANINKKVVLIINQFIKLICIFSACFLSLKKEKGLIKGIIAGIVGAFLLYVIFAIFKIVDFNFVSLLFEMFIMGIAGGIFGIISVNRKR